MEIITKSAEETKNFGAKIANKLATGHRPPDTGAYVIALSGELGSGKTTFVQGFAKGLGINERILSPTFILMRLYELESKKFYHVDLYRLENKIDKEMENLGLLDIFKDSENIVLIEWAEKAKETLPPNTVWVNFQRISENERKITVR
jgi:tRNA threonylcarbamoyladenosine biosynthesis protein TsaE